jgi:transglutaminase-like putative cysteine protease
MQKHIHFLLAVLLVVAGCGGRGKATVARDSGETWLRNSIGGKPVGYSVYRFDQHGGYRFESFIKLSLAMGGKNQDVQSKSKVTTGPDLTVRDFSFTFSSQDLSMVIDGQMTAANELTVIPQGSEPRHVKLAAPAYPASALGRLVVTRMAKESAFSVLVFDATVMDVMPTEIRILGREKVKAGGKEYDAVKFTVTMGRLQMTSWVDDKGLAVREESPPGMVAERVDAHDVLTTESGSPRVDVLTMFRVKVDTLIPEPADVRRAKLEIGGIAAADYGIDDPNQQVTSREPLVLEIATPVVPTDSVPLPVSGQAEFLKPSISVQCDDPGIKARTADVVGGTGDAVSAARKLVSWVFTAMDKEATASYPTAVDVLKTLKGDCNEHAVLLAAMARAAGIPARVAVGLVYLDGAFYYHAWNELYLGRWIPVDATFGEFPAGALHLKLAAGELSKQTEILGLVGRIRIKVLEFSRAAPEQ